ncbi:alcohol dehydrogenase catalytic domain-containing protein [Streptomyces sp. NPDC001970]
MEIPTVIERDALLVRMTSATLCGTDVHVADGAAGDVAAALPLILGHETVGRIVAFGDGPRTDSVGRPLTEGDRQSRGARSGGPENRSPEGEPRRATLSAGPCRPVAGASPLSTARDRDSAGTAKG